MNSRHFDAEPGFRTVPGLRVVPRFGALPGFPVGKSLFLFSATLCLIALAGCQYMPWRSKAPAAPKPVNELLETTAEGAETNAYPQYWKRNTLVIDLSAASSAGGSVILKPKFSAKWPIRIALRVMPGTIGLLEVQADQRLLMPVTREGSKPVDLELVPGVYSQKTAQVSVRWEGAH